jgi:hypothetical protein
MNEAATATTDQITNRLGVNITPQGLKYMLRRKSNQQASALLNRRRRARKSLRQRLWPATLMMSLVEHHRHEFIQFHSRVDPMLAVRQGLCAAVIDRHDWTFAGAGAGVTARRIAHSAHDAHIFAVRHLDALERERTTLHSHEVDDLARVEHQRQQNAVTAHHVRTSF